MAVYPLLQRFYWDMNRYTLSSIMNGHAGTINAFSFNTNGSLLASGGDDEQVKIWDMKALRLCQSLMNAQGRWGQITCLEFINFEVHSSADWLCFGTGRGMIALYRKGRKAAEFIETWSLSVFASGDSVETLAFDSNFQRLAVGSHYGHVKMLRYQNGKFCELWGDELRDAIPRALLFGEKGRTLNIFTLETGTIYCRDAETSMNLTTRNLKTAIGHVSQCQSSGNLLVDNMHDGFDIYPPNRFNPLRTFRINIKRMYVRAGVFCEGGKTVACGSDHGRVYLFRIGDERPDQELPHGRKQDLVQTIEAKTSNGFHIIVSGASSGDHGIYVWKKPVKGSAFREKGQLIEGLVTMNALFLLVVLWLTREIWGNGLKGAYTALSTLDPETRVASEITEKALIEAARSGVETAPPPSSTPPVPNSWHELHRKPVRQHLVLPALLRDNSRCEE